MAGRGRGSGHRRPAGGLGIRGRKNPYPLRSAPACERARSSARYSTPREWGAETIYAVIHQAWIQAMSAGKVSGPAWAPRDNSSASKATVPRIRQDANDGTGEFGSRRLGRTRFLPLVPRHYLPQYFGSRIERSTRNRLSPPATSTQEREHHKHGHRRHRHRLLELIPAPFSTVAPEDIHSGGPRGGASVASNTHPGIKAAVEATQPGAPRDSSVGRISPTSATPRSVRPTIRPSTPSPHDLRLDHSAGIPRSSRSTNTSRLSLCP